MICIRESKNPIKKLLFGVVHCVWPFCLRVHALGRRKIITITVVQRCINHQQQMKLQNEENSKEPWLL